MASPHVTRSDDEIIAAATAGHIMAGMPPTPADIEAALRVLHGETTVAEELAALRAELRRRRTPST